MADSLDYASRTPANRENEMTYLPFNSIQERSTGTGSAAAGFNPTAANLPPYDPLRS